MKCIVRYFLIGLFFSVFLQGTLAASYIGGTSPFLVFQSLGVELKEKIATTYFAGDGLLIQGRVTNNKDRVFFYLKNIKTEEVYNEGVFTDKNGNFSIPVSIPKIVGDYYIAIASGESFTLSNPEVISIILKSTLNNGNLAGQSISPNIVYARMPYVNIGSDKWANMQIDQFGKRYSTSGKILTFNNIPLTIGRARVTITGYGLSSPSPLDQVPSLGFNWSGYVYLDRTREKTGENLVALRAQRSLGIMQFRIKSGEKVESYYFLTSPNGNVTKYYFPNSIVDDNGYLRTNVLIRQNFPLTESGVYKIETVRDNGVAYFNLPISKTQFWSIIDVMTLTERTTIRTNRSLIDGNILKKINNIRVKLGLNLIIQDEKLSSLAQQKAKDMATYNYAGHRTHSGLGISDLAKSLNINITGTIGENVALGSSDIRLEDGLEESGSHRYNMINPIFGKIGIGYFAKNGVVYLVQVFGE